MTKDLEPKAMVKNIDGSSRRRKPRTSPLRRNIKLMIYLKQKIHLNLNNQTHIPARLIGIHQFLKNSCLHAGVIPDV